MSIRASKFSKTKDSLIINDINETHRSITLWSVLIFYICSFTHYVLWCTSGNYCLQQ